MDSNLLSLYLYAAGKSNIPVQFHKWTLLTLVSAAVSDRIFFRKPNSAALVPNLYTMFLGPSAVSKGAAISFGMRTIDPLIEGDNPAIYCYYGQVTNKALIDYMNKNTNKFLLVMPELASNVGDQKMAEALVRSMTDWYTGFGADYTEATRMHGPKTFKSPVITWLAGSTLEWFIEAITIEAVLSGFFGRCIPVYSDYRYDDRMYEADVPDDAEECLAKLRHRFYELTKSTGQFTMNAEARELDEFWYHKREERKPEEESAFEPFWWRIDTLAIKLAMICSLCNDPTNLVLQRDHVDQAHRLIDEIWYNYLPTVLNRAMLSHEGRMKAFMERLMVRYSRLEMSMFRRKCQLKSMRSWEIQNILGELLEEGTLGIEKVNSLQYVYRKKSV